MLECCESLLTNTHLTILLYFPGCKSKYLAIYNLFTSKLRYVVDNIQNIHFDIAQLQKLHFFP